MSVHKPFPSLLLCLQATHGEGGFNIQREGDQTTKDSVSYRDLRDEEILFDEWIDVLYYLCVHRGPRYEGHAGGIPLWSGSHHFFEGRNVGSQRMERKMWTTSILFYGMLVLLRSHNPVHPVAHYYC